MRILRSLAVVFLASAVSGCSEILGLDSGEVLDDEAGSTSIDGVSDEASVSGDAGSTATTGGGDPDAAATVDAGMTPDGSALSCGPGKADCNGDPKDGCEANLDDPSHCGSCTNRCPAMSACVAETCCFSAHVACAQNSDCCSGNCDKDKHTCH